MRLNVSMPLLDSSIYDCIVEHEGRLSKVQIKNANDREQSQVKKGVHISLRPNGMFYNSDFIDVFAIYIFDGFFIIPNKEQRAFRFIQGGSIQIFLITLHHSSISRIFIVSLRKSVEFVRRFFLYFCLIKSQIMKVKMTKRIKHGSNLFEAGEVYTIGAII